MQRKYRIAILGIGGVGGFLGGMLAVEYYDAADVEILFIARGGNAKMIEEQCLKLIIPSGEMIARPAYIIEDVEAAGPVDLLICCTKSYDLEASVQALSSSLTPNTMILPLLNGIDATERIQAILPGAKVLHGCIYIVSKLVAPGVVQQGGDFHSLHFGGDGISSDEARHLLEIFQQAGVNAIWEDSIREKVWDKFSFISPLATYTSAYNITVGQILDAGEHVAALKALMYELGTLAEKLNVRLAGDFIEKNLSVMKKLPATATSSLQADFANGRPTELETLTGVVVQKAAEKSVKLDAYTELFRLLSNRPQNASI